MLLSGFFISVVMLGSAVFRKATAYSGLLANGLALGFFAALLFAPALSWLPPTISAPFRLIWYILIAVGLFRLWASTNNNDSREYDPGINRG